MRRRRKPLVRTRKSKRIRSNDSSQNDGLSREKAIVVGSIAAEYDWIQLHYPGFRPIRQTLRRFNGHPYDILVIRRGYGEEVEDVELYFDISSFLGKKRYL